MTKRRKTRRSGRGFGRNTFSLGGEGLGSPKARCSCSDTVIDAVANLMLFWVIPQSGLDHVGLEATVAPSAAARTRIRKEGAGYELMRS